MGDDLAIVNAARVSFAKQHTEFENNDARLIAYLARHGHESPFAHTSIKFHFEAPIFVARQLAKHQVGFAWNEVSGRYVELKHDVWHPKVWRKAAANVKQGSSDEFLQGAELFEVDKAYAAACRAALDAYKLAMKHGVCKEQARAVYPLATYTEWHWTGSLLGWARVWRLRTKPDAQRETQELVKQLDEPLTKLFPVAWEALKSVG
jgi:thymidylate synthase (FAD)